MVLLSLQRPMPLKLNLTARFIFLVKKRVVCLDSGSVADVKWLSKEDLPRVSHCHAEPQTPRLMRMDKRVLWLTVSNTAKRLRKRRTDRLANQGASSFLVTAKIAVSLECADLRPDWLGSWRLSCERDSQL